MNPCSEVEEIFSAADVALVKFEELTLQFRSTKDALSDEKSTIPRIKLLLQAVQKFTDDLNKIHEELKKEYETENIHVLKTIKGDDSNILADQNQKISFKEAANARSVIYSESGQVREDDRPHTIPRSKHQRITWSPGVVNDIYADNSQNIDENAKELSRRHGLLYIKQKAIESSSSCNTLKLPSAMYQQFKHLCMDDLVEQKTKALCGIPILMEFLDHESVSVCRNAARALRNLLHCEQNEENIRVIELSGGIPILFGLLRKSADPDVKILASEILFILSSCEDLKHTIINDGLSIMAKRVIIRYSGWRPTGKIPRVWSVVYRNTSGVLRNVSSAGEFARKKLREYKGLVDSLLHVVENAIHEKKKTIKNKGDYTINNKIVENCLFILQNLSYRCQEVQDPIYEKYMFRMDGKMGSVIKVVENFDYFERRCRFKARIHDTISWTGLASGMELLWQPSVVETYLDVLISCSNPETLEATVGVLRNLTACYWKPSVTIRSAIREYHGIAVLIKLLEMKIEKIVCAVASTLSNLVLDSRNKRMIGEYFIEDLVLKLPSNDVTDDKAISEDTLIALLATLNEVIKVKPMYSKCFLDTSGIEKLKNIIKNKQKYSPKVQELVNQMLFWMWQHQELRITYEERGWKEEDFVTKASIIKNTDPKSINDTRPLPRILGRTIWYSKVGCRKVMNFWRGNR